MAEDNGLKPLVEADEPVTAVTAVRVLPLVPSDWEVDEEQAAAPAV